MRLGPAAAIIALFLSSSAEAQSGPIGGSGCLPEVYAGLTYCSPPMGTIVRHSQMNMIVCGRGQCVRDTMGQVYCAAEQGGAVVIQPTGQVQCVGGCEIPRPEYCQAPR
jgi:hypothetical protein